MVDGNARRLREARERVVLLRHVLEEAEDHRRPALPIEVAVAQMLQEAIALRYQLEAAERAGSSDARS